MTLDDAVATLLFLADHHVEGVGHTRGDGFVTADFFLADDDRAGELMDALHAASEAMSVVCAVVGDREANQRKAVALHWQVRVEGGAVCAECRKEWPCLTARTAGVR